MKFQYKDIVLEIPENVYCPREDSLLMAETIESLQVKGKRVLEMGCGSGLLSIILSKNNNVTAIDINSIAVNATKSNAAKNNINLSAIKSDLFSAVKGKYDIIVFNPPYLPPSEHDHYLGEEKQHLIDEGVIERFLNDVPAYLNPNGFILLLVSSLTKFNLQNKSFHSYLIASKKLPWEELKIIKLTTKK